MAFNAPQWFSDALTTACADPALDHDARWPRFLDPEYRCPCCGIASPGLIDMAFDHPDVWPHGSLGPTGEPIMEVGIDRLTTDLCRVKEAHFVRCILPVPIRGHDGYFCFGPWALLAREHFEDYARSTMEPYPPFEGCEAVLANTLPGANPREPVPCLLTTAELGSRPALFAHGGPIRQAQEQGITLDTLLDIYAAAGTDLRGHLDADPAPEAG
ncbi:DUF2199 domain-containing protein [Vannielia litorea]|uniref:DUF2199 domain-containing protein n=1 Tax=Vannielia litorea TaxID=1217970 RepID=UPI001BCA998A|nr:DUF2199 domain-containing protein [Vannielia litorea]MBS8229084.1 DUF2199 domain-containing protein [Vannielia litorea]